jgi:hypothetical protein
MTKKVTWLKPVVRNGVIKWPVKCEAMVTTQQTVAWREAHGRGMKCNLSAKIDFNGKKLCTRHASLRALATMAGPMPDVEFAP